MSSLERALRRVFLAVYRAKIWIIGASWEPDGSGAPVPPRVPSIFERLGGRLVTMWEKRFGGASSWPFEGGRPPFEPWPRAEPAANARSGPNGGVPDPRVADDADEEGETIPLAWLTEPTTVEAAESANMVEDRPFGGGEARWRSLRNRARSGDQFWWFVSPAETWRAYAGRMGVALVRDGEVIDRIVTRMN